MQLTDPSALSGELKNQYQEGPAIMTEDQKLFILQEAIAKI